MSIENFDAFLADICALDPSARSVKFNPSSQELPITELFSEAADPEKLVRIPKFMFVEQDGRKSVVILDENMHYDPMGVRLSYETKVRAYSQDREKLSQMGFDKGFMHPMFDNSDGFIERFYIDSNIAKQWELYPESQIVLPAVEDGQQVKVLCSIDAFMQVMEKHYGADNIYHANVSKGKWQQDPLYQYMSQKRGVSSRFAPSPTGSLHVGSFRSALMPHLLALSKGGHFTLRIDDTNKEKSREEYVGDIVQDLSWIGVTVGPSNMFRQSDADQVVRYHDVLTRFQELGFTEEDDQGNITLNADAVLTYGENKGTPYFSWIDLQDGPQISHRLPYSKFLVEEESNLVLAVRDLESDEVHVRYKLAGELHDAEYSHVFRDYRQVHLTERQALIQLALKKTGIEGIGEPIYGHVSLVSRSDKTPYSKSSLKPEEGIKHIRENGVFLPEAVLAAVLTTIVPSTDKDTFGFRNKDIVDACARDGLEAGICYVAERFDASWVDDGIRRPQVYFDLEKIRKIEARIMRAMPEERFKKHLETYFNLPEAALNRLTENRAEFSDWQELTDFIDRWYTDKGSVLCIDMSKPMDMRRLREMLIGKKDGPSIEKLIDCMPQNRIYIIPKPVPIQTLG